ncbi:bifunctional hydroxymethylpyrimidine kinase/phosphomethylpyrimidine kinase [Plesiomonas shigelloides]
MPSAADVPIVLTIAGSDSSGGAGIQADIKAISATGSYACSVITAITAQNTLGVSGVFPVSAKGITAQLDAVFSDLNIVAVKIGMLGNAEIIDAVSQGLQRYRPAHIVLDPVMVATSGDVLLEPQAISALKEQLLPLADIITPNLPEAAVLIGHAVGHHPSQASESDMAAMIEELRALTTTLGTAAVLLKGGHLAAENHSDDVLITAAESAYFHAPRILTRNTHGTGCTLSAAIASYLAQGYPLAQAVAQAKDYIGAALAHADLLRVGQGHGPVHHFFPSHGQLHRA